MESGIQSSCCGEYCTYTLSEPLMFSLPFHTRVTQMLRHTLAGPGGHISLLSDSPNSEKIPQKSSKNFHTAFLWAFKFLKLISWSFSCLLHWHNLGLIVISETPTSALWGKTASHSRFSMLLICSVKIHFLAVISKSKMHIHTHLCLRPLDSKVLYSSCFCSNG